MLFAGELGANFSYKTFYHISHTSARKREKSNARRNIFCPGIFAGIFYIEKAVRSLYGGINGPYIACHPRILQSRSRIGSVRCELA